MQLEAQHHYKKVYIPLGCTKITDKKINLLLSLVSVNILFPNVLRLHFNRMFANFADLKFGF